MEKADLYTKHNTRKKKAELLDLLKEHESLFLWGPDEVVLDAGCGPGDVTADVLLPWLPPDCQAVLGVDISPAMVRHALKINASDKLSFAEANIGEDVSHIIVLNEKYSQGFDKIFSFYMLHWLLDFEKGIRNLKSLLKPQGQVFVYFPVDRRFQKTYRRARALEKWREYFKQVKSNVPTFLENEHVSLNDFQPLFTGAGFKIEKCELRPHTAIYATANDLKDLIESLEPELKSVPDELIPEYLSDCLQFMEEDGASRPQEDGSVHLIQTFLVAVLTRS